MKLRLLLVVLLVAFAAPATFAQTKTIKPASKQQTEQNTQRRIVYDVSEGDTARHVGLMRQLNNVKRGWPDAQIEVVVHGKALDLVIADKSTQSEAIKELQGLNVTFVACENTMRVRKVEKNQLLPGVGTVPMAVGEIVTKQGEGWGYIKF
jgi:uncharacterized protein